MSHIDVINCDFYNSLGEVFDKIPFVAILPGLLLKYQTGHEVLEIGSGAGALALWLVHQGHHVTCVEPATELASLAAARGLEVHPVTIQNFQGKQQYDMIVAISSLIHVPKVELSSQIEKLAQLLRPGGKFFVSFIEGNLEGLEDPTGTGKDRFFCQWTEESWASLLSPHFHLLENHSVYVEKMGYTFLLGVYCRT